MSKYKFKIKGLDCASCANELENALQKIDIIENVSISFMTEKLVFECTDVEYDPQNSRVLSMSFRRLTKVN